MEKRETEKEKPGKQQREQKEKRGDDTGNWPKGMKRRKKKEERQKRRYKEVLKTSHHKDKQLTWSLGDHKV